MATTERHSNELLDSALERLSRRERGWEDRPGQREMARLWSGTLHEGGTLVVEAPTGIGKSLAYLLPALLRRVRGSGPVVVSTCTKALQDQLLRRDVPLACRAIGAPLRVVALKGRQNYLCRRRAEARLNQRALFPGRGPDEAVLEDVRAWTERTLTGELTELAALGLDLPAAFLLEIASDPLVCSGSSCEAATGCFAKRARREALRVRGCATSPASSEWFASAASSKPAPAARDARGRPADYTRPTEARLDSDRSLSRIPRAHPIILTL